MLYKKLTAIYLSIVNNLSMWALKKYIPFLRIISFYYSDFRLVNTKYDNIDIIFSEEIKLISSTYIGYKISSLHEMKDYVSSFKERSIERYFFIIISSLWAHNFTEVIDKLNSVNDISDAEKDEIKIFYDLIIQSNINDSNDMSTSISYLKNIDNFLYNIFAAIFVTFRWKQNLIQSISYINRLILIKPHASSFYLFRVRNLFLFFYQSVIWVSEFNHIMTTEPSKILGSKYIKLIFKDIELIRSITPDNPILAMFEWNILIHLHDKRWVDSILEVLKSKYPIDENNCYEWLWNYYLYTWEYLKAESFFNKVYPHNFKIYRKFIATYVLSKQYDKLQAFLQDIQNKYVTSFYLSDSITAEWESMIISDISRIKYDTINIPLDIEINTFLELLKKFNLNKDISMFFTYIRKDIHKYYLHQLKISILLVTKDK